MKQGHDERFEDDPRLTAYALGELEGAEREEIEKLLAENPEARALVDEMRGLGELVTTELAKEPAATLTDEQHRRIEAAAWSKPADDVTGPRLVQRPWFKVAGVIAAAAGVLLVLEVTGMLDRWLSPDSESSLYARLDALGYAGDADSSDDSTTVVAAMSDPLPATDPLDSLQSLGYIGPDENTASGVYSGLPPTPPPYGGWTFTVWTTTIALARVDNGKFLHGMPIGATEGSPSGGGGGGGGGATTLVAESGGSGEGRERYRAAWALTAEELNTLPVPQADGKSYTPHQVFASTDRSGLYTLAETSPAGKAALTSEELNTLRDLGYLAGPESEMTIPEWGRDELTRYQGRGESPGTEGYDPIHENAFVRSSTDRFSTFSIDVDTASYANSRRFLTEGKLPPRDAVRIEEFVNYFRYDYPEPTGEHPFAAHVEVAAAPWAKEHRLVRVGLKGREPQRDEPKARNFVFLLDVSGSMNQRDKLPLLQQSMRLLVEQLDEDDHIAIVTYAGNSGLALPVTSGDNRAAILDAIGSLSAGGSTNGASGIQLAYQLAREGFFPGGVNRVILATDGDFNVGITDRGDLIRLIEKEAKSNVFLSVLGFGTGNLKDSQMEQLADKGNGNYSYIDSLTEARKVLVHEMDATLETIAKDVKIQIEFNPGQVRAWRLIGYENRILAHQDFADDRKDAGEIGAGHTVTALYEVVPIDAPFTAEIPSRYQPVAEPVEVPETEHSDELLFLRLRYKEPEGTTSKLLEQPIADSDRAALEASADFRFAAAVASFGMLLRGSQHAGTASLEMVHALAVPGAEHDRHGTRQEFLRLVDAAIQIAGPDRPWGR